MNLDDGSNILGENQSNKKNHGIGICFMIVALSFIVVFFMLMHDGNRNDAYTFMPLLPFAYAIISFLFIDSFKHIFKNIVFTIIAMGYFIKMVLYPLLSSIGGYASFFTGYAQFSKLLPAIIYFVFEYLILMCVCHFSLSRGSVDNENIYIENSVYKTRTFKVLLFFLSVFLIFAYYYVTELQTIYYLPTDIDLSQLAGIRWNNETLVARGSIKRYIYTLFMFIWPIVRYLLPALFISMVYTKYGKSRHGAWIAGLCCLIPCVFLGGDNFAPFLAAAIALMVIRKLYGSNSNGIFTLVFILGTILLVIVISSKLLALANWRGATGISNLAQLLNGYFPGVENMALTMQINESGKLSTFFYDVYSGIPFAGTLFGLDGESFNDIFNAYTSTGGQIVPFGGNIGYYTTYFLSPFIYGWVVYMAFKYEKKSKEATEYWTYYVCMLFSTYTAIATIIYSSQIYIRFIFNILIPILIIRWLARINIGNR